MQDKNERQWKKSERKKRVTKKFHVVVVQNNGREVYQFS